MTWWHIWKWLARVKSEPVQLHLERGRHWFDLTLVTTDRPLLFANMTGVLAAWGMSIVKANAFSNAAGSALMEALQPEWLHYFQKRCNRQIGYARRNSTPFVILSGAPHEFRFL
jgi:UTP:GlnB (protein PII) uridylyltransferase